MKLASRADVDIVGTVFIAAAALTSGTAEVDVSRRSATIE